MIWKAYFRLRYLSTKRFIVDNKISVAGVLALIALFIAASFYAMKSLPAWIYALLPALLILSAGRNDRYSFLGTIVRRKQLISLMVLDALLDALPFLILMIAFAHYQLALLSVTVAVIVSFFSLLPASASKQKALPTPYRPKEYELNNGFRANLLLYVGLIFVLAESYIHNNMNLNLVMLGVYGFSVAMSLSRVEDIMYLHLQSITVTQFLIRKCSAILIQVLKLLLTPAVAGAIFFHDPAPFALLMVCIIANATGAMLVKYAFYNNELLMSFLQLALLLPAMVFISLPAFFPVYLFLLFLIAQKAKETLYNLFQ